MEVVLKGVARSEVEKNRARRCLEKALLLEEAGKHLARIACVFS
jgi:hypothetical protein